MNLKIVSNNVKDIIEELANSSTGSRDKFRLIRYANNVRHLELSAIFRDPDINLVLDVGANEGQFANLIRKIGYSRDLISFEPIPETFARLKEKTVRDSLWSAFNYALGSSNTRQTFNIYSDSKLSSFLQGDGSHSTRFENSFQIAKQIEVEVKRFDSVWSDIVNPGKVRQIFLKLDTQGYDLEVFKGIGSGKNCIKFILTELSVIPLYKNIPTFTEALDFYSNEGYGPLALIPVTRNHSDGRVIEFDCLLRKI